MTFINNVSYESGNKTTALIQFVNLFLFYTKIKTSLALKNLPKKTLPQVGFLFLKFIIF